MAEIVSASGLSKDDALALLANLFARGVSAEITESSAGRFVVTRTVTESPTANQKADAGGAQPKSSQAGSAAQPGASLSPAAGALLIGTSQLKALFQRCCFSFPQNEMVFFGIRGALPSDVDDVAFAPAKQLTLAKVDYRSMACTIGQWTPEQGVAVFPGSTVPNEKLIAAAANRMGEGANVLARCKVAFTRGVHKQGTPTAHQAFRQDGYFPGIRSRDAVIGDEDDYFDTSGAIFWDDLHAAWSGGPSKGMFSSAGCQVVAGFPASPKRAGQPNIGPWATFKANAYDRKGQARFVYALFGANDLARVNSADPKAASEVSLRFGSEGDLVLAVQERLEAMGFDPGPANGQFGRRTLQAVLAFQAKVMGPAAVDGVVGGQSLTALGLSTLGQGTADATTENRYELSLEPFARLDGDHALLPDALGFAPISVKQNGSRWSGEVGGTAFPIGTATRFTSGGATRIGLFQSGEDLQRLSGGRYDPAQYRNRVGDLAYLLAPTAAAESGFMFNRLNTYDRAAFTYGFLQLAAHTPRDNLILLLKKLLTLKDHQDYLPDLSVQGGLLRDAAGKNLEEPDPLTGDLTRLMRYFKPNSDRVTDEEARAGARFMAWCAASNEARDAQVETAAAIFKQRWLYFSKKYGVDLQRLAPETRAPVFVWAMDIRHQGRGAYSDMAKAINGPDPVKSLSAIGAAQAGRSRMDAVAAEIAKLPPIDWGWL